MTGTTPMVAVEVPNSAHQLLAAQHIINALPEHHLTIGQGMSILAVALDTLGVITPTIDDTPLPEQCPECDGPLYGDLFHDDDPNGRPYCAACCPKCIAERDKLDARRAATEANDA